jgi:hypothetical protein
MTFRNTTCALACCALMLVLPAGAGAAVSKPGASTDGAKLVSYASAIVQGRVNPNGSDTSYYFQYGPTRAYGSQSSIAAAGAGTRPEAVAVALGGLAPLTRYHYRIVAVNAGGVSNGADRTFMTTKVPLSLAILASPSPVAYGGDAVVQGSLSGTGAANRAVVLQADPFPYAAGFQTVTNPELTNAAGGFSFPVLGLTATTQYRVVTFPNPTVASPVAVVGVTAKVSHHVHREGAHRARIFGTVTPAQNGAHIAIMRIVHGHGVPVAGGVLRPAGSRASSYSRTIHVRRGVYRVLVQIVDGALASSYSQPFLIR